MVGRDESEQGANPYSTGGGGTVLEHRFGAVLLAHLLLSDPVPALGDDVMPVAVRFQDSAFSPVDDLVVVGGTADGGERRLSIGVRRAPKFTTSDDATGDLLVSYIRVVTDHWDQVRAGRWRLALAVASPNPAVQQVRELAAIAQGQPSEAAFRAELEHARRTNSATRTRLTHLDALIAQAANSQKVSTEVSDSELTWRVLHALWLWELRLEGIDVSDRTGIVGRLRSVVPDSSVTGADALFEELERLSRRYGPAAASVTESMLRQHLSGTAISRSPSHAPAWRALDALSETAENLVRFCLTGSGNNLELERARAGEALAAEMKIAASHATGLVVTGEPDAGKSALVLRTARRLRLDGAAITLLNLREVPASLVEIEALLGARIAAVLGASAVGTGRLLAVDGAESVLEGRAPLLSDLARAAMTVGLGVVAVTRTDGSGVVLDVLNQAAQNVDRASPVGEDVVRAHEVSRLTAAEIEQSIEVFPQLRRWASDQRTAWLLGRPGLVEMLLRAGPEVTAPEKAASEADLFAAVWHHLVRRGGVMAQGAPPPDTRDQALRALARRELLPRDQSVPPDALALPSLRSDGLLAPLSATSAWNPSDRFASDLVRDMAVVSLFITDGFELLAAAEAPRWALRAARVACQADLLNSADMRRSLQRLRAVFDQIAIDHGERWSDVPWEAVLTLGTAREALGRTWPELQTDRQTGLRTAFRLAMQRYATNEVGDPVVLGPLVEMTFCRDHNADSAATFPTSHDINRSVRDLVLAWLRGLVLADRREAVALRQTVRDRILSAEPKLWDEFAMEALSMLGPDFDERVEHFLRDIANRKAAHLNVVVERLWPVVMMARHQPDVLLTLTESYYIERRDTEGDNWPRSYLFDDGIRSHRGGVGPLGRMAGWHYGPFWQLLNVRMVPTLALINRMLDHAASIRVGYRHDLTQVPEDELLGVDLDLPGLGVRHCTGDGSVWAWYRGSSVGPYPCMSALLAVERLVEQLVAIAGLPLHQVVQLLMRECNNLAMPGLVLGFLVRHLEHAGHLLDQWMRNPDVWHLEFARVAGEGALHVQGPDDTELVGRSRRRSNLRDVAAALTIRAVLAADQTRLDELAAIGDELVRRAEELVAGSAGGEEADWFLTSVQGWASTFLPENYHSESDELGNLAVQYEHPEPLATRMRPEAERFARNSQALRLLNTYAKTDDRVASVDTLLADVALARSFGADEPDATLNPLDPIAAIAAAAAVAHSHGYIYVPVDDLRWAAEVLIRAISEPSRAEYVASSFYSIGADRSAAVGLPALLAIGTDVPELDRSAIIEVLERCTANRFYEVRIAFALAVGRTWAAPCDRTLQTGECHHQALLNAVRAGLRDCCLGDWDPVTGRRGRPRLDGPYERTLPQVETDRLYLTSLIPPLIAVASASRSEACVAGQASGLVDVLLDAHARATDHWAREGYENRHSEPGARVIVDLAVRGNAEPLKAYVQRFASNGRALHDLLQDFAVLFTYDDDLRPSLPSIWAVAMECALDAIDDGAELRTDHHWGDYALGALLPAPSIRVSDTDIDATLARARAGWLHPGSIAHLVDRWIPIACQEPKAVDALAQLGKCASLEWQRDTGLTWAERLVAGAYSAIANHCFYFVDWLEEVHTHDGMLPDHIMRWRRIVDGLAAAGDHRAARLQRIEE
ncbi:hypothetical protein ABZ370_11715 [Streptomyces sp. NPDC005962]|uniref:hypothetical protein n=1 Tax=Streptomyces sp. NPDC005962 TaxID=3154466 RepID=UPI003400F530